MAQPNPAPRFDRTPGSVKGASPAVGENTREGLVSWGFEPSEVDEMLASGVVGWKDGPQL